MVLDRCTINDFARLGQLKSGLVHAQLTRGEPLADVYGRILPRQACEDPQLSHNFSHISVAVIAGLERPQNVERKTASKQSPDRLNWPILSQRDFYALGLRQTNDGPA